MTTLCSANEKRPHGENEEEAKPSVHVEHARCGRSASEKEKPWAESFRRAVGDDAVVLRGAGQGRHRRYDQSTSFSIFTRGEREKDVT